MEKLQNNSIKSQMTPHLVTLHLVTSYLVTLVSEGSRSIQKPNRVLVTSLTYLLLLFKPCPLPILGLVNANPTTWFSLLNYARKSDIQWSVVDWTLKGGGHGKIYSEFIV